MLAGVIFFDMYLYRIALKSRHIISTCKRMEVRRDDRVNPIIEALSWLPYGGGGVRHG